MPMKSSSILKEIAELSNPRYLDYDPEDIAPDYKSVSENSDQEQDDVHTGREHYVSVRYPSYTF
jgi:hypothetical protein